MNKSFLDKNYFVIEGKVMHISDLIHIDRKGVPDLYKKMLTITTSDKQTFFPEIRNKNLKMMNNIQVNDIVEITFAFQGTQKHGKSYNNIYIHNIIKK